MIKTSYFVKTIMVVIFVSCFVPSCVFCQDVVPLFSLKPLKSECYGTYRIGDVSIFAEKYSKSLIIDQNSNCTFVFNLGKKYKYFKAVVGINDDIPDGACYGALGEITVDNGNNLIAGNWLKHGEKPKYIEVDISDSVRLEIYMARGCTIGTPILIPKDFSSNEMKTTSDKMVQSKSLGEKDNSCPLIMPKESGLLADKLAKSVSKKSGKDSKPLLTVVAPFKSIGLNKDCEKTVPIYVQEDTLNALIETDIFIGAERDRLEEVLKELNLQQSDLVDEKTARKVGKKVGADAVLIGSISVRENAAVVIQARLVDVEKGTSSIAATVIVDNITIK